MNQMILMDGGTGVKKMHRCQLCRPDYIGGKFDPNRTIPIYYSEQEAKAHGWHESREIKTHIPPEQKMWVCPECWNDHMQYIRKQFYGRTI